MFFEQAVCASAFTQAEDAVKEVTKAFDPEMGKAPPMNGKTVVVTGGNSGERLTPLLPDLVVPCKLIAGVCVKV